MPDECPYGEGECLYADCDERDHTCGCGECCDACWFDCCASADGILCACDMAVDFDEPITNCGLVPLEQLDFLISEWTKRKDVSMTDRAAADTPEGVEHRAVMMQLLNSIAPLETLADLDLLDDYSIILTCAVGMSGSKPELLCRAPGGWYSFWRNREGKIEIIDEWTPTLPALLMVAGVEEDMIGTPPTRAARHAARASDPQTSHEAVRNRQMGWDTMNMRALRMFYDSRDDERGLSYHQVERLAVHHWGVGALGKSPWKRCSELHTDFDPPLIDRDRDEHGTALSVSGEFGDPVDSFRITAAGVSLVQRTEPTA